MRQLGFVSSAQLVAALALFVALLALPCAIVLTLALIRWYRHRVARSMHATAAAGPPQVIRAWSGEARGRLEIGRIDTAKTRAEAARAKPLIARARRDAWQLGAIYAAAAMAYSFLLATAMILANGFAPTWNPILALALLYVVYILPFGGTPVALAPTMVLKRQPRFLIGAVLALIALMWALDRSIGGDMIGLWLMIGAVPTAAVLFLNTRRLRAVGPIVFAAALLLLYGLGAGVIFAALYALDVIGPMRWVRSDLAGASLVEGMLAFYAWLWSLPPEQMLEEVSAIIADPRSVMRVDNPQKLTTGVKLEFFAIWMAAAAAGLTAAWALVRWLARSYRSRRASDQMLTIDVLMLIFAVPMILINLDPTRWETAAGALAGLAGYKLVARWGLHRRQAAPMPRTLLLLRVFGFDRRTQRLLDDLGQRWRYLGPIWLIGGTDLAYATLEPHEFFEFLNGRLSRDFIKDGEELESRLAESSITPDPDGRFRVDDFFCHENSWRMTVSRLAREAAVVLMDLRGFTPANRGCIFEIEQLIAAVPVDRIVLLVDGSTDVPFLERTLEDAWRAMPGGSPNVVAGQHRLRVLQSSESHGRTLATLLGLLCEGPAEPALCQDSVTGPGRFQAVCD